MIGHPLAAASAIGTASAVMAMNESLLPPTINLDYPDPVCDLDYIPNQARHAQARMSLVTASGFSGIHSALVLQLPEKIGEVS
jgi:3-oxoacyl-(acyl-carrier-protein) synthase